MTFIWSRVRGSESVSKFWLILDRLCSRRQDNHWFIGQKVTKGEPTIHTSIISPIILRLVGINFGLWISFVDFKLFELAQVQTLFVS